MRGGEFRHDSTMLDAWGGGLLESFDIRPECAGNSSKKVGMDWESCDRGHIREGGVCVRIRL